MDGTRREVFLLRPKIAWPPAVAVMQRHLCSGIYADTSGPVFKKMSGGPRFAGTNGKPRTAMTGEALVSG
jgi:hypothetical protein